MGAKCLLRYLRQSFNRRELCSYIKLVWVDGGYRGDDLMHFAKKLWGWQVVLRTDDTKGFKILPRGWIVERTFAWPLHARRLNKDYEKQNKCPKYALFSYRVTPPKHIIYLLLVIKALIFVDVCFIFNYISKLHIIWCDCPDLAMISGMLKRFLYLLKQFLRVKNYKIILEPQVSL